MNLVTSYVVDDLGRVTEKTNPNGTVDYFVYNDALNEVREYDGWSDGAETGPTKVTIDDLVDGYDETLTMTATPTTSDGVPTGAESIADVQSLTRTFVTVTGVEYQVDSYFNLGGLTYTSGSMGSSGTNYYETQYGYDDMGNLATTIDPQGTIYITVFDGQGRKISTWVGTDDTPESGSWSPTNNTSPSNMVETESFVYDGGNPGDSDLTQTTQYPGGGATDRVADYWYNWRAMKRWQKVLGPFVLRMKSGYEKVAEGVRTLCFKNEKCP
jgi:YD repeat-containing protein